jgi:pimeloyl-ACP methyl ester carboxylesterase
LRLSTISEASPTLGDSAGSRRAVATKAVARYELLTGPGSSHALMMERPEEFLSLVLGFLENHPLD